MHKKEEKNACMHIYIYIYIYIHTHVAEKFNFIVRYLKLIKFNKMFTSPSTWVRMQHKINFLMGFNRFEFSFPSPRLFA